MSQLIERAVVKPLAWGRVDRWFAIGMPIFLPAPPLASTQEGEAP
jgi:hypothetical protein